MTRPVRLRLSRAKGFNLQESSKANNGLEAVGVAHGKWGNPFIVGKDGSARDCVDQYRLLLGEYVCLTAKASVDELTAVHNYVCDNIGQLRGKNLACFCQIGKPCHADVLLKIANRELF